MKTFPIFPRHKTDESSIALIVTLAVMSLLLVLVLSFAAVTKVEIQTATSNRDLVASKYLAQAALERALADLAGEYARNTNLVSIGISGGYSEIHPGGLVTDVGSGFSTNFITDIERVVINPLTGRGVVQPGSDGVIDFVSLPQTLTNFFAGVTPQWIGLKDTNGNLVGRVAFVATGGSLCINAIGNADPHATFAGFTRNTRNEGHSPAEINLVAALVALGWTSADALSDVNEILLYRYGANDQPGASAVDDDANETRFAGDKMDNDGNGTIDGAGEGTDEPQEYLYQSDATNSNVITPYNDDLIITDLKNLHTDTAFSAAMRTRFLNNFGLIQRYFTTQSPVKMDPNMINLNDPTYLANPSTFYSAILTKMTNIGYLSADPTQRCQVAANIVTYKSTNMAPYWDYNTFGGDQSIVGVTAVPHLNEIVYRFVIEVQRNGSNKLTVRLNSATVTYELWYPYTNNSRYAWLSFDNRAEVNTVPDGTGLSDAPYDATLLWLTTIAPPAGVALANTTNATQFTTFQRDFTAALGTDWLGGPFGGAPGIDYGTLTSNLVFTSFGLQGVLGETVNPWPKVDYSPRFLATNMITFTAAQIQDAVNAGPGTTRMLTNSISFQLNDPRVKSHNGTNWAAFVGSNTLGTRNYTSIYNPTASYADDVLVTTSPAGIGPKTFYVATNAYWRAATELGRVHRGEPWTTISLKGGGVDGILLDHFTTWYPGTGTNVSYLHGRVNVNTDKSQFPVWAGLFAGMPLWDGTYVDYTAGGITTPMAKTSNLINAMVAGGKYSTYSALPSATKLSDMRTTYGTAWPTQTTDEEKEWLLDRMYNLIATKGSGNFFTVWAWGQSLKGGNIAGNKTVAAESLIMAMVRVEPSGANANLRVVYFRYNPDLEFHPLTQIEQDP